MNARVITLLRNENCGIVFGLFAHPLVPLLPRATRSAMLAADSRSGIFCKSEIASTVAFADCFSLPFDGNNALGELSDAGARRAQFRF